MFLEPESSPRMNQLINFISSRWEGYLIKKLDNNQWKCLWCDITFQGITDTKALDNVVGIRGMHIKSCSEMN